MAEKPGCQLAAEYNLNIKASVLLSSILRLLNKSFIACYLSGWLFSQLTVRARPSSNEMVGEKPRSHLAFSIGYSWLRQSRYTALRVSKGRPGSRRRRWVNSRERARGNATVEGMLIQGRRWPNPS